MGVAGVAGQQQAALYGVDQFRAAFFDRVNVSMLGLPTTAITEARGIVGMEMFGQNRVVRKLIDSTPRSVAAETAADEDCLLRDYCSSRHLCWVKPNATTSLNSLWGTSFVRPAATATGPV